MGDIKVKPEDCLTIADENLNAGEDKDFNTEIDNETHDETEGNPIAPKTGKLGNSCPVCKAVVDSKKRLLFHMRKHIAKPVCYLCGKRLKSKECLKEHLRRIHNQDLCDMKPEHATAMPVSVFLSGYSLVARGPKWV